MILCSLSGKIARGEIPSAIASVLFCYRGVLAARRLYVYAAHGVTATWDGVYL